MRTLLVLAVALVLGAQASAQDPIEGPLTEIDTTPEELATLSSQNLIREGDGFPPHLFDFPALGEDCLLLGVQVWHFHDGLAILDDGTGCGHSLIFELAQEGGNGGPPVAPQVFSDEFIGNGIVNPLRFDPESTKITPGSGRGPASVHEPDQQPFLPSNFKFTIPDGPKGKIALTVPQLLETSGSVTNSSFTFDTALFMTYTPGLAGVEEGGAGASVELYIFNPTTGVLERTATGDSVSSPVSSEQLAPGPFGGELRANGLQGNDTIRVEHTGPLGGLVGVGFGDRGAVERTTPLGFAVLVGRGDDTVLIADGEPHHADDDVYSLEHAVDKMVRKITGPLAGPDQATLGTLILDTFGGTQPGRAPDGATTPGKTLEDAAKDAVAKNKAALDANPGARNVYDGLQKKANADAQSSDAHDAARGRQWHRVLDAIGKAAGWPTSGQMFGR